MAEDLEDEEDWAKPVEGVVGLGLYGVCSASSKIFKTKGSKGSSCDQQETSSNQVLTGCHSRTIVHIDLDCFYAQVEMVRNPSLRTKPLGIQQKYLLVTCNYVARSQGVTKLMRVTDALQRCPDLVIVSGEDLTHYREMSYRITELLHQFSPLIERLGFDENYIDATRLVEQRLLQGAMETEVSGHVYGETSPDGFEHDTSAPPCTCGCRQRLLIGSHIAQEMRQALNTQLGLTSCAGVAHNKLLAKLVGTTHKPNDQTTLWPHMASQLMGSLNKVTQVPGIGHSTGKRLSSMGITTLTELVEVPFTLLKDEFGYQSASTMRRLCQGHDESPVVQSGPPQSISDEDSFKKCSTLQQAQLKITALLKSLLQRLRNDGRQPHTLRLSVRKYSKVHKWSRESRQCSLPNGMIHILHSDEAAVTSKLLDLCISLFHKMVDVSQPFHLTLINVCFAKFQSPSSKTTTSDISKFFKPRSATKGRDDEPVVNDSQFETSSQSVDSITKDDTESNKIPSVAKIGDAISKRLSRDYDVPSLSARTIPTCSYRESHDMQNRKCSTYRQFSLSNESSRSCPWNERDISASNVDTQPSPATRIVENNSSVGSMDVSPKKRTSFFALKTHLEKGDRKRYLSAHFESETQIRDTDDWNSVPTAVDTGEHQLTTPSQETMHQSSGDDSRSYELLENTSKEHMEMRQSDDTAHCAIPPNVDPSVFDALPLDVRQELLNEWRKKTCQSKSAKGCVKESSQQATFLEFPDIDHSVFEELPPDVQKDVLEQQKQKKRTLASLSPASQRTIPGKRPRTGKMPSEKGVSRTKNKCIKDFLPQNETSL